MEQTFSPYTMQYVRPDILDGFSGGKQITTIMQKMFIIIGVGYCLINTI